MIIGFLRLYKINIGAAENIIQQSADVCKMYHRQIKYAPGRFLTEQNNDDGCDPEWVPVKDLRILSGIGMIKKIDPVF